MKMEQQIEKYLSKNLDAAEQKAFLRQTEQDPELRKKVIEMKNISALWELGKQADDECLTRKGLEGLNRQLEARHKRHRITSLLKYAAMVLLSIAASWFIASRHVPSGKPQQFTEINVPKGQCVDVTLADGSKVCLSPLSKMRFSNAFNDKQRVVELDGEGYFSVTPDKERPFTVRTSQYNVQVLGTEFNVFAYSKQKEKFETCLVKGKVKVYNASDEKKMMFLNPDEKIVLVNDRMVKQVSDFGDGRYVSKGIFKFRMKNLEEILDYLSLWNDVRFTVCGEIDLKRKISGKFHLNSEVSAILDILQGMYDFEYRKTDDNHYTIYKRAWRKSEIKTK